MAKELSSKLSGSSSAFRFLLAGALFLAFLFYYAWDYLDGFSYYRSVQMWPVTLGTVVKNTFSPAGPAEPKDPLKETFAGDDSKGVVYTYKVDGKQYTANCLILTQPRNIFQSWKMFYDEPDPKRMANQYPVGSTVEVHYNFAEPHQACLDVTSGWKSRYIAICFMALIIIVPAIGFLTASLVIYLAENRAQQRSS